MRKRILSLFLALVLLIGQTPAVFAAEDSAEVTVARIAGKGRSDTAEIAADVLKAQLELAKFDSIIIASGLSFADALAGSYLAAVKSAPILLYSGTATITTNESYIIENLSDDGTVYLLGGSAAVPAEVESRLNALGITVERLFGNNRYDTNLEILKEAGGAPGTEILVATATNFADSLSASATGKPILLVNGKGSLSADQKAFLEANGGGNITILGGTDAVKASIERQLTEYGTVKRIAGTDRYQTSAAIAKKYYGEVDMVVIAYGGNFPDGLSGGPVAYAMGAPLILTASGAEHFAGVYIGQNQMKNGYIMGGTAAITDRTVEIIFSENTSGSVSPDEQKHCRTCGQNGHDMDSCLNGFTYICGRCGADENKVNHWLAAIDLPCDICGEMIPAWKCHIHEYS